MVNTANQIEGRKIRKHPLEGKPGITVFPVMDGAVQFLAGMTDVGGVLMGKDGARRFQAGDYVITDDPPTHAWMLNSQAFRASMRPVAAAEAPHAVPDPAAPALKTATAAKSQRQRKAARQSTSAAVKTKTDRRGSTRPMATPRKAGRPADQP